MKTIVGIFAHPDDETFGPGGTLTKLVKEGNTVYIICATNGENANGTLEKTLGKQRRQELLNSAKILGIKKVYFLDFQDGSLSNSLYHKVATEVKEILRKLKPDVLITFEQHGVSGHIDHVFMSMVTQFLFPTVKSAKKLMMYCLPFERSLLMRGKYFIYFPYGYLDEEIDEIVDIEEVWDTKVEAMHQHVSQLHDVKRILKQSKNLPKKEYFLVEEKS